MIPLRPALAGVVAATAGLTAAEFAAALLRPESSPLVTIGGTVIDATPTPLKEYAVRTVGTYDKPLLLLGIAAALAAAAAVAGIVAARRRTWGLIAMAALGGIGILAALSRPTARPFDALPAALAGAVAAAALAFLIRRTVTEDRSRRAFLTATSAVAGGAALAGLSAVLLQRARGADAERTRADLLLPAPVSPAGPRVTSPGFYTPVRDFYRVDTALTVPRVDVERWELRLHGLLGRPLRLGFDDLLRRGLIERDITLNCVSNEVGGAYIGTTRWLGVPLAPLLKEANPRAGADQVVARSVDGMTIGTPLETLLDGRDALLAVAMDGAPLPPEHGFPVRMLTPGLYGYAGSAKWLVELELTTFDAYDVYWVRRGWARRAPVKTASRIDVPAAFARVSPGDVTVAGVAWAQRRGISGVEVQVDGGLWERAELLPTPSPDTWVQWRHRWRATLGGHTLRVRAVDGRGDTQPERRVTPFPDGATGWHTLAVTVA